MDTKRSFIDNLGWVLSKIAKAIVSGLPKEKIIFKPTNKVILTERKIALSTDSAKHYHRPMSKPVVEKQTLIREKKKAKTVH